jgi:SNF2 family DNA or RNA helicase
MLANIVNGLPPIDFKGVRTTLIVLPPSLITNWLEEIEKHCDPDPRYLGSAPIIVHHGKTKVRSNMPDVVFTSASIVITSYGEICRSAPKVEFPKDCVTEAEKIEYFEKNRDTLRGIFHKIHWHRIVLDESHVLKYVVS